MSCIDSLGEKNPCVLSSVLTGVALTAAAAVAIGVITLLANQHLITFTAFSLGTPLSLAMSLVGCIVIGAVVLQSIRSCCGATHVPTHYAPGDSVPSLTLPTSAAATAPAQPGRTPSAPAPSPLNPSGTHIQPTGASASGKSPDPAKLVLGKRPGELDDLK